MAKWMYNKDGAKLFNEGTEIPSDYVDCPEKVGKEEPKKKTVKKVKK